MAVICTALSAAAFSSCSNTSIPDILYLILPSPTPSSSSIMGLMIAPSYTMPEDEAIRIICEEASLYGIKFDTKKTNKIVAELPFDVRYNREANKFEYSVMKSKLDVDGIDKDKHISFEYVSDADFTDWSEGEDFKIAEIRSYFMSVYINSLKDNCFSTENGETVGVFAETLSYNYDDAETKLRQQVSDFIEMLKIQDLI